MKSLGGIVTAVLISLFVIVGISLAQNDTRIELNTLTNVATSEQMPLEQERSGSRQSTNKSDMGQSSIAQKIAKEIPRMFAKGATSYVWVDLGNIQEKESMQLIQGVDMLRVFSGKVSNPPFSPVEFHSAYVEESGQNRFKFVRRKGTWQIDAGQDQPASVPRRFWVIGWVKEGTNICCDDPLFSPFKKLKDGSLTILPTVIAGPGGAVVGLQVSTKGK